ncbi:MAG: hypothetical protein K9G43_04860 [Rhodobacteraceae bacterium]|nr:hypothetical protein [Paracoccaceae bacterium]
MSFWSVFWEAALTGKIVLVGFLSVIVGYVVGFGVASVLGRILAFCGFFLVSLVMLATSSGFEMLTQLHRHGATNHSGSVMATITFLTNAMFLACVVFGVFARKHVDEEVREQVAAMGPESFFEQISVLYADPRMSSGGWFADRWAPMTKAERLAWCGHHLEGLRALRQAHSDGFGTFNPNLASRLAQLDLEKSV